MWVPFAHGAGGGGEGEFGFGAAALRMAAAAEAAPAGGVPVWASGADGEALGPDGLRSEVGTCSDPLDGGFGGTAGEGQEARIGLGGPVLTGGVWLEELAAEGTLGAGAADGETAVHSTSGAS